MTYEELRPLLEFVGGLMGDLRGWTPQMMAGALTVESVEKAGVVVPPELERALVGFRHRRTVDREAVCRRFLEEGRASGPVPKPAAGVRLGKRDRVTLEMSFILLTLPPDEDARAWAGKMLNEDNPRISDKWGPAGCYRMSEGNWLFFGYASS